MYKFDFTFSPRSQKVREIKWLPYKEGLKKAEEENKLAVLVISASWCSWCHVMDETTFSDERIIKMLNTEFIPIRADADLEPEIEARYGSEGLPSVSVISPHGITLGNGNFFSSMELEALLNEAKNFFSTQRKYYFEKKEEFEKSLKEIRERKIVISESFDPEKLTREVILQAVLNLDPDEVGFAGDGKFPHPEMLNFLLAFAEYENEEELLEMPLEILKTAIEKLMDQEEGGFFRYARLSDWSDPQTDKHLYDNAQILEALSRAYRLTGEEKYLNALTKTVRFIVDNLSLENGLFGICVDALDDYYLLKPEERILSKERPRSILEPVAAYNARLASAFTEIFNSTKEDAFLKMAQNILNRLEEEPFFSKDRFLLKRHPEKEGFLLQDSAETLNAAVSLYLTTRDKNKLEFARSLYFAIKEKFYDENKLAFKDRVNEATDVGALLLTYHPLNENALIAKNIFLLSMHSGLPLEEKTVGENILKIYESEAENLGPFAAPLGLASISALKAREAN